MKRIGKFEILETAGRGGMGTVYKAFHPHTDSYVALKEIHPELAEDEDFRAKFRREIQILEHLPTHPNIVRLRDSFEQGERLFLVMDFIDGDPLRRMIQTGPTNPGKVRKIVWQILSALEAVHAAGVVHRDLKADNVLIDRHDKACVTDFGIAEMLDGPSHGPRMGTARYTAPELVNPKLGLGGNEFQADLYAVGILAYELLTGEKRFREAFREVFRSGRENVGEKWFDWHADLGRTAPRLHEVNPKIPFNLSTAVDKLMAKNVKDRFRSASEAKDHFNSREYDSGRYVSESFESRYESRSSERRPRRSDGYGRPSERERFESVTVRVPRRRRIEDEPTREPRRPKFGGFPLRTVASWAGWFGLAVWGTLVGLLIVLLTTLDIPGFTVVVQGAPFGSEIHIDNVKCGIAASDGTVRLYGIKSGNRLLKVSCEGFGEFKSAVTGRDGEVQTVVAQLAPVSASLPDEIDYNGPMILIPAGEFIMGDDNHLPNEKPAHKLFLEDFYIDKLEVTNAQYRSFCDATNRPYPLNPWWNKNYFLENPNNPVVGVTWEDARAYSDWIGKRLVTEFEWEKAACWGKKAETKNPWPWGTAFEKGRANQDGQGPATVGSFPTGASAYGVLDMSGSVAEWTDSLYLPYPGNQVSDKDFGADNRVVRGGSFRSGSEDVRTPRRFYHKPLFERSDLEERSWLIGFRCAVSASDPRLVQFLQKRIVSKNSKIER